jgi:hypothetical protein
VIESLRSGSMKPKLRSNAVERSSKIWCRVERIDCRKVVSLADIDVEYVMIPELCDAVFRFSLVAFRCRGSSIINR